MHPVILPETLESFAYTNGHLLKGKPLGIVVTFHGLNMTALRTEPNDLEMLCAQKNILTLFPYYGPWSWMNDSAVAYVDTVVAAAMKRYALEESAPVISVGGSMGGLSALVYTRYARITPKACFANCPVCDLPYHATERPDLPRTVYLAFMDDAHGMEEGIRRHSPLHLAAELPRIPYCIIHGTADAAVNKQMHSDRLAEAMRANGHQLLYQEIDGMQHCDLASFPSVKEAWETAITEAVLA